MSVWHSVDMLILAAAGFYTLDTAKMGLTTERPRKPEFKGLDSVLLFIDSMWAK